MLNMAENEDGNYEIVLLNFLYLFSLFALFAANKRKSEDEADTNEPAAKRVSTPCDLKNEWRFLWSNPSMRKCSKVKSTISRCE